MLFLVIDDDELSRELLALLLSAEGHEVETAASGEEALARLHQEGRPSPHVILTDMQMPGLSGSALASALRKTSAGTMTLLAMSGSRPAREGLSGFDGFLLKPFSMADLDAALAGTDIGFDLAVAEKAVETDAAVPALNEEIYAKMAKMMPAKQLGELYAMCLADARQRRGQMGSLAAAGDDEGYRKAAHTVKGGCGMIGATELYALAETAEREGLWPNSGRSSGTGEVAALLERFSRACDRLERILGNAGPENTGPRTSPHPEK